MENQNVSVNYHQQRENKHITLKQIAFLQGCNPLSQSRETILRKNSRISKQNWRLLPTKLEFWIIDTERKSELEISRNSREDRIVSTGTLHSVMKLYNWTSRVLFIFAFSFHLYISTLSMLESVRIVNLFAVLRKSLPWEWEKHKSDYYCYRLSWDGSSFSVRKIYGTDLSRKVIPTYLPKLNSHSQNTQDFNYHNT